MLSDTMMLGGGRKAAYPIDNSLLFRGSQYLTRTPAVVGNRKTFTFSCWFRRSALSVRQRLLFVGGAGDDSGLFNLEVLNDKIQVSGGVSSWRVTTSVLRDVTAWYHVVLAVDTRSQIVDLYINGERVTAFETSNDIPVDLLTAVNSSNVIHYLGRTDSTTTGGGSLNFLQGYMAEPILVDGSALDQSYFGQIDPVTGSWRPKAVSGVDFGTNGFYLGKPWNAASLGTDASGRGNDWTPVGFAASDVMGDSPTNVYATLNPLMISATWPDTGTNRTGTRTLSEGNTRVVSYASTPAGPWNVPTFPLPSSGKFIFENYIEALSGGSSWHYAGVAELYGNPTNQSGYWTWHTPTYGVGDYVYVAVDCATREMWCGKKVGSAITWVGDGDPVAGTSPTDTIDGTLPLYFCTGYTDQYTTATVKAEFDTDKFQVPPPAGFLSLCTANLPATTGQTSGTFTGTAAADGPCVYTGAVPETLSVNGNPVIWGTHADKLATGFKIRTASLTYNASGANSWAVTYDKKPTVGPKGRAPANAQSN